MGSARVATAIGATKIHAVRCIPATAVTTAGKRLLLVPFTPHRQPVPATAAHRIEAGRATSPTLPVETRAGEAEPAVATATVWAALLTITRRLTRAVVAHRRSYARPSDACLWRHAASACSATAIIAARRAAAVGHTDRAAAAIGAGLAVGAAPACSAAAVVSARRGLTRRYARLNALGPFARRALTGGTEAQRHPRGGSCEH